MKLLCTFVVGDRTKHKHAHTHYYSPCDEIILYLCGGG